MIRLWFDNTFLAYLNKKRLKARWNVILLNFRSIYRILKIDLYSRWIPFRLSSFYEFKLQKTTTRHMQMFWYLIISCILKLALCKKTHLNLTIKFPCHKSLSRLFRKLLHLFQWNFVNLNCFVWLYRYNSHSPDKCSHTQWTQ